MNIAHKIISSHLIEGEMIPGKEIGLRVDQTLTQDATGTMAWLQFEALGLPTVRTELSVRCTPASAVHRACRGTRS